MKEFPPIVAIIRGQEGYKTIQEIIDHLKKKEAELDAGKRAS